ncbi:MAG: hypothetical protein J5545_12130 [Bacteroidaceae bacterium]|nr:hypothetical protein [Bacteroidaceae bacterium]
MKQKTRLNRGLLILDRTFSGTIWWQIIILLVVILAALAIGLVICYFLQFGKESGKVPFYEWALYLLIDSNALNNIYTDSYCGGRPWGTLLCAILGSLLGVVLFGGMLISVLSNMLERRIENYRKGKNTYVRKNHYVILGYDEIVPSIIKQICTNEDAYVLLQSSVPSEMIADMIHSSIAQECEKRVIIKNGHRTSTQDLSELRLNKASDIYIVGDRTKPSHDAMNIDCMEKVYNILKENKKKGLPHSITTVFEDQDTYAAMQVADLFENIRDLGVEFIPYNFYADWAKQMFVDCRYMENGMPNQYPSLDGEGITENDERHVHLVIVGTSNFGVTLGVEAAKMLHFPNFKKGQNLTRITFIDLNADKEKDLFMTRYRHFFEIQSHWYDYKKVAATKFKGDNADFLDVEFEFIKGDVYSSEIQKQIADWASDETQLLSLVFAMRDSRHNMAIAMNLPDEVYEKNVPVFIRQNTSSKFLTQLHAKSDKPEKKIVVVSNVVNEIPLKGRYVNLYPFGMTDIIFDVDKKAQRMAECINHLYSKCQALEWAKMPEADDVKKCTWEEIHTKWIQLPVAFQWSNLYSAYNIEYRLHSIQAMRKNYAPVSNITDKEAETLGRVEHDRWNVEKLLLGYRKPSEDEDYYAKKNFVDGKKVKAMKEAHKALYIHCDIRPYTELDEIQEIDKEIIRYIPWFKEMAEKYS